MKEKRYARSVCVLLAMVLKAGQRVCFPLLPDCPLTVAVLAGEGVYLLLALGVGLGMIACGLDLTGRAFWTLYGRCAGLCLICRGWGLLLWQSLGSHWVVVLYASEVAALLVCGWQIRRVAMRLSSNAATAYAPFCKNTNSRRMHHHRWVLLVVLLITLVAVVWAQAFVCHRCSKFVVGSPSYQGTLHGLALPMGVVEGLVFLAGCWLLLPAFPDRWQTRRSGVVLVLLLGGCISGLGLFNWLVKPQGFLMGMSQASATTRQSLDWTVEQPWYSEITNWHARRHLGESTEDWESLRILHLRDHRGRLAGWTVLTEPLVEETFLLDGQPVQLLYPYGLLLPAGDTLRLVRLAELSRQPEDPLLTAFCHVSLADFRLFSPCAGYLLRYDPDAVRPKLERYAAASFTPEEHIAMGELCPEYVICQAQKLLKKGF